MVVVRRFNRFTRRQRQPIEPRHVCLGLDTEMRIGWHKNRTVRWILEHNPSYMRWLLTNNGGGTMFYRFSLDEEATKAYQAALAAPGYRELLPHQVTGSQWW